MLLEERDGFSITIELMFTAVFVTLFSYMLIWMSTIYMTSAFFLEVLSSTSNMAARYGGSDSVAYKIQTGSSNSIEDTANKILSKYTLLTDSHNSHHSAFAPSESGRFIEISSRPDSKNDVTTTLTYRFGDYGMMNFITNAVRFSNIGNSASQFYDVDKVYEVKTHSLMQRGALI